MLKQKVDVEEQDVPDNIDDTNQLGNEDCEYELQINDRYIK